jgi:hypothetical protein
VSFFKLYTKKLENWKYWKFENIGKLENIEIKIVPKISNIK